MKLLKFVFFGILKGATVIKRDLRSLKYIGAFKGFDPSPLWLRH